MEKTEREIKRERERDSEREGRNRVRKDNKRAIDQRTKEGAIEEKYNSKR